MSNYWMPWLNSQRIIGSDSFNDNLWSAYNSASLTFNITPTLIPINTEVFDNGGDFNPATYTYTTPTDGYYTFRLTPHLTVSTGTNIFLYLLIDGVEIFIDNFFVNAGSQVIDTTYRIGIDAGSSVQFKIANQTATSVTLNAGNGTYNASLFQLAVTEFNFNQTIYYNLNAPDMKQIDFVTDVIKMHNCAIVPDRSKPNVLYVVPQNSYLGSGGSSSVDFQNIPATYQHLQIRIMALPDGGGGNLGIRFNNDSGSNYSGHQIQGNGSAAEANEATSQTSASRTGLYTDSSIYAAVTVIDILDYANTNKHKTIRALTGQDGNATGTATAWRVGLHSGRWGDSTAINRITTTGVTFREKTTFALYGIKGSA